MINRVQAFNNKSNYKQNFGMAVESTPIARQRFNNVLNNLAKQESELLTMPCKQW